MSHFLVAVFLDGNTSYQELLAPYDERLEVPRKISKEEGIKIIRDEINRYRDGWYAEYIKNPRAYKKKYPNNPDHIEYISKIFPIKLKWTDEDCYAEWISRHAPEDVLEDGSISVTANPNAKWDWYDESGGGWGKLLVGHGGDKTNHAWIGDIDLSATDFSKVYAVVTPDGEWHAPGTVGWWGMSSETDGEAEKWKYEFNDCFIEPAKESNWEVLIVDCHI